MAHARPRPVRVPPRTPHCLFPVGSVSLRGEFYIKIRCIQLRITLATLDVVPKRAVGILRQPDAGRSFKLNPLENGFQSKYGGFVAIKQPPDTQFT